MGEKEEEQFQSSKIYWICEKLIGDDDEKVRDHCHVTGKFRGAAHWSCNINLPLTNILMSTVLKDLVKKNCLIENVFMAL